MIYRSLRWPFPGMLLPVALLSAQSTDHRRQQLDHPQVIDGVSCAATGRAYAEFHLSGSLRSCPLSRDTSIAGHRLYAKTWITLDTLRALRAAWLSRDTELSGHLCHGTDYKGFTVRFRQDQSLAIASRSGRASRARPRGICQPWRHGTRFPASGAMAERLKAAVC